MKKKLLVLGAGLVGSAIIYDLALEKNTRSQLQISILKRWIKQKKSKE